MQKCTRQPPTVHIVGSFQVVFPWPQDFREICKMPQTVRANHSEFDEFTQLFDYLNSLITTWRLPFWDSACTLIFCFFFQQSFSKQLYVACTKVQFRLLWYDVPSLVLHHMVCILERSLAWCSPCTVFLSFLIIIIMIINLFVLYLSLGKSTWRFSTLPDCKGKGQKK